MWKFQVRIFQHIWEISRQIASWPGRAGSGRAGPGRAGSGRAGSSRISVLHQKRITFCSMHHIAKINISRVMMLFCLPVWLWQEALCVDRRAASRRVSLLRSLTSILKFIGRAIKWFTWFYIAKVSTNVFHIAFDTVDPRSHSCMIFWDRYLEAVWLFLGLNCFAVLLVFIIIIKALSLIVDKKTCHMSV